MHDRSAASAFTNDSDAVWVTTEEMDVRLHPLERQTLIVQTDVGSAARLERGSGQPSEQSEAVVQSYKDDSLLIPISGAVKESGGVAASRLGTCSVSASVDPDKYWGYYSSATNVVRNGIHLPPPFLGFAS